MKDDIAIIAIGRNEGERLHACLRSAVRDAKHVVYVDSGSTDDSVAFATSLGVKVVSLEMNLPFTAARGRNAGAAAVPVSTPFLQFVDGDCEIVPGWIDTAVAALEADAEIAVVCGRRRERFPDATRWNKLCDDEWATPIGPAESCGGDAMYRREAFDQVGGFNNEQIAGEEPELCIRLREIGWQVWRLDAEMTLHDAAMTRWQQWWKRHKRAGHAYAENHHRHGVKGKQIRSNVLWSLPIAWPLWPVQAWRIGRRGKGFQYGLFTVLSKLPQAVGQCTFWWNSISGKRARIIEYKG